MGLKDELVENLECPPPYLACRACGNVVVHEVVGWYERAWRCLGCGPLFVEKKSGGTESMRIGRT